MIRPITTAFSTIAEQLVTQVGAPERRRGDRRWCATDALTLDTIFLCGFNYRFNSFYRSTTHPSRNRW